MFLTIHTVDACNIIFFYCFVLFYHPKNEKLRCAIEILKSDIYTYTLRLANARWIIPNIAVKPVPPASIWMTEYRSKDSVTKAPKPLLIIKVWPGCSEVMDGLSAPFGYRFIIKQMQSGL